MTNELTDCSKCRFRNCCTLVWDYGSLYCNDYEEEDTWNIS